MVEYRLAKARVAGSNPVSCFFCVLTDKERMDCQWLPDDMQVLLAFFIVKYIFVNDKTKSEKSSELYKK